MRARVLVPACVYQRGERAGQAARHHRRDGEAGRDEDGRGGALQRHRRPHLARDRVLPRVPQARRAGRHLRDQQPVLVDGRRQVLQLRRGQQAGRRDPQDRAAAAEGLSGHGRPDARVAEEPRVSGGLGRAARLRRPAGDPQAVLRRWLEARLQGARRQGTARGVRRHGAVLHDAAGVHRLRSVRALLHLRQDGHRPGALRPARAPLHRQSHLSVVRPRRSGRSRTRRRSTRRWATR